LIGEKVNKFVFRFPLIKTNKQTKKQRLETGTAPSNVHNNSEKNTLPNTKDLKLKKKEQLSVLRT